MSCSIKSAYLIVVGKGPQHTRKAYCKDTSFCDERYWGSNASPMEPQRRPPQSAFKPGSGCCILWRPNMGDAAWRWRLSRDGDGEA